MPKAKTVYLCQSCGYRSPKWLGRCPDCGQWNAFAEQILASAERSPHRAGEVVPVPITQVELGGQDRFPTQIEEFDRILGGGVVPGSLVLVGGDPGIGKSTLMLQVAARLGAQGRQVVYISGEESAAQTRQRAERLSALDSHLMVFPEVNLEQILGHLEAARPWAVVVDSIQAVFVPDMEGGPGSVGQIRECTGRMLRLAKSLNMTFFLIGHVTKSGAIAGPRLLEHMVDTVLYFEGDRHQSYRILRAVKNRFGSTNEIGVFEMASQGLREVPNPSEIFLAQRDREATGSVVVGSLEGTRPLLVELQALVSRSTYSVPQRVVNGVEYGRLVMLLAVLERRNGLRLSNQDIFVNAAGGIRMSGPDADLGIVAAVVSSCRNRPVDPGAVVAGEVGLGGEVRAIPAPDKRIKEAEKLGFQRCLIPAANMAGLRRKGPLQVVGVKTVQEALEHLLRAPREKR